MPEKKTTDAQLRAARNWEKRNRSKATIDSYRRHARGFIRNHATADDLDELEKLITERRSKLQNQ